ncbi:MAG: DNA polymerase domain-containing protein [Anaerolineales bacterium]
MADHRVYQGWLLDLYTHPCDGLVLWLLCDDTHRRRFRQDFPVTFYAAGPNKRLRALWKILRDQPIEVELAREERRDLFSGPTTVLAARVHHPHRQPGLFRQVARQFPDLNFYNADVPINLHHAAIYDTFPLARCRIRTDGQGNITHLEVLDSPWKLHSRPPPLRVLIIEPDTDPFHASPTRLYLRTALGRFSVPLHPRQSLLRTLQERILRYDPDLLLSAWGDTWLLPNLLEWAEEYKNRLPLNRELDMNVVRRAERSYFAYGQVIYRGEQVKLFGRYHIDIHNAVMYRDYGLDGIWELARVTSLPVQTVARVSPGTGISAMQIVTALREGILVPWHKQEPEALRSAAGQSRTDLGGLVAQPSVGLHRDVAEIDFISMYPSIMRHFNISPELVGKQSDEPGLIPRTLAPLLDKRIALKQALLTLPKEHPNYKRFKAYASAHKWLLVTCFGYLGYKNARFGRIEAHEAITAMGREVLLQAKEAAEEMGFNVLHMYVDGIWINKEGCKTVKDFDSLLVTIHERTGLPIALDGIFRWMAFLPSKEDARISVANRYFGVFRDGSTKERGIELRRHDTPIFVAKTQRKILNILAQAEDGRGLPFYLPEIRTLVNERLEALRRGQIPLDELIIRQRLSRELDEYRTPSSAACAAMQLEEIGRNLRPGQSVRLLYLRGEPNVRAWDLPEAPNPAEVDLAHYRKLLLEAVETILEPIQESKKLFPYQIPLTGLCHTPEGISGRCEGAYAPPFFSGVAATEESRIPAYEMP